ncbi:hypothetical protein ACFX2A_034149 [Malus domestica]
MGMNLDSGELLAVKQVLIAANSASKEKAQAHIKELEEEVKLLKNLSHPNIVVSRTALCLYQRLKYKNVSHFLLTFFL